MSSFFVEQTWEIRKVYKVNYFNWSSRHKDAYGNYTIVHLFSVADFLDCYFRIEGSIEHRYACWAHAICVYGLLRGRRTQL